MLNVHPASAPAFLKVERSVLGRAWRDRLDPKGRALAESIVQQHGLSDALARVLAGRGVACDDCIDFLEPTLRALMPDPSSLSDMDFAVARLVHAVQRGETIAIFGDYDVDGTTAVSLVSSYLKTYYPNVATYIPDRYDEGYGISFKGIDFADDNGFSLIIALD